MPRDRHHSPRLQGVELALGAVGRGIPQVHVHPEPQRGLGLGREIVKGLFTYYHDTGIELLLDNARIGFGILHIRERNHGWDMILLILF